MGRTSERQGIELAGRMNLIEADVDRLEERVSEGLDGANEKLNRILWAVITLVLSVLATLATFIITSAGGH